MTRFDVRFIGRVQGVFFRATAVRIAADYEIAGWVRNEADGSVRCVVEGEPSEIDRFVAAIRAAKRDHIDEVRRDEAEATGEFAGFEIRR